MLSVKDFAVFCKLFLILRTYPEHFWFVLHNVIKFIEVKDIVIIIHPESRLNVNILSIMWETIVLYLPDYDLSSFINFYIFSGRSYNSRWLGSDIKGIYC